MERVLYRHTQKGYLLPGALIGAAFILGAVSLGTGLNPVNASVTAALLIMAFLFYSLTVEIREDVLIIRFGPGFIRKRIALADIREAKVVRNPWYYGWGVRITPHGWLYNVSGLDAVEIVFGQGKTFRIGTDEPQKLAEAIRAGRHDDPQET
jgi:hypothetical protein